MQSAPSSAEIRMANGELPFKILNGHPGYINFMDALNSWQLVKELKASLNMPAAASFKHVSPAGAALGLPLTDDLKRAYHVEDIELSPLAADYVRARGSDRMFLLDWAALYIVQVHSVGIKREVSDGVIALGYTDEALDILKQKRAASIMLCKLILSRT